MEQKWKDVVGFEGLYKVSDTGKIYSVKSNRVIKHKISKTGYCNIELHKDGKPIMKYVHRLVAEAFVDNPTNKPQVNHKDGNKQNNHFSNLEWVTASENQRHALLNGLHAPSPMAGKIGALNPCSKTIYQYDTEGNFIKKWDSISDASRELGIGNSNISNCLSGRYKTAGGYKWSLTRL